MAVRISDNIRKVSFQLKQLNERAVRGVSVGLNKAAIETAQQLETFMPFDTGLLRKSITINGEGVHTGNNERNNLGQFEKQSFTIGINGRRWRKNGKGKGQHTVASYAWLMNSSLLPYGDGTFNLGKKSQKKRDSGQDVGGFFMERAHEYAKSIVTRTVAKAIRKSIKGGSFSVGSILEYGKDKITYGDGEE